jgi:hypothetical protein
VETIPCRPSSVLPGSRPPSAPGRHLPPFEVSGRGPRACGCLHNGGLSASDGRLLLRLLAQTHALRPHQAPWPGPACSILPDPEARIAHGLPERNPGIDLARFQMVVRSADPGPDRSSHPDRSSGAPTIPARPARRNTGGTSGSQAPSVNGLFDVTFRFSVRIRNLRRHDARRTRSRLMRSLR